MAYGTGSSYNKATLEKHKEVQKAAKKPIKKEMISFLLIFDHNEV